MPMGRTPGHLSRAISLQARKGDNALGSTKEVQSLRANAKARELHNFVRGRAKVEVHKLSPTVRIEARRTSSPLGVKSSFLDSITVNSIK